MTAELVTASGDALGDDGDGVVVSLIVSVSYSLGMLRSAVNKSVVAAKADKERIGALATECDDLRAQLAASEQRYTALQGTLDSVKSDYNQTLGELRAIEGQKV